MARWQLEFVREFGDLRELALRAVREERHLAQELRSVTLPNLHAGDYPPRATLCTSLGSNPGLMSLWARAAGAMLWSQHAG